jgi:hypothetical protein
MLSYVARQELTGVSDVLLFAVSISTRMYGAKTKKTAHLHSRREGLKFHQIRVLLVRTSVNKTKGLQDTVTTTASKQVK